VLPEVRLERHPAPELGLQPLDDPPRRLALELHIARGAEEDPDDRRGIHALG
jgi:hypothetical protein